MPSTPSEIKAEELIIQLLKIPDLLSTVPIVHFDADAGGSGKRIVVKVEEGTLRTDGPGGFDYRVDISVKGLEGDQVTWDDWRAAIETRMNTEVTGTPPAAFLAARAQFSFFRPPPKQEQSSERDRTDAIRTGTQIFQFIAKAI